MQQQILLELDPESSHLLSHGNDVFGVKGGVNNIGEAIDHMQGIQAPQHQIDFTLGATYSGLTSEQNNNQQ